jgi:hypothetical protein
VARVRSAGLPWSTPRPSYPRHGWAIQPLTELRLRESNYLRSGRASREAISALRHTDRRPPSPDDWGRWRPPEVDRVPCLRRVQQACARCAYFIHAIEGHHREYCGRAKAARASTGGLCDAVCADNHGGIGPGARRPLSAGTRRVAGGASCPWSPLLIQGAHAVGEAGPP